MGVDKYFEEWLEGKILTERTRREFAIERRIDLHDLQWAFNSGYTIGVERGLEMSKK